MATKLKKLSIDNYMEQSDRLEQLAKQWHSSLDLTTATGLAKTILAKALGVNT